jgi:hypothetical protein
VLDSLYFWYEDKEEEENELTAGLRRAVQNSQLTCSFFELKTRNVFARSTCLRLFNRIASAELDAATRDRSWLAQKISKMLCLARGQR